jgi:hypothetical protein
MYIVCTGATASLRQAHWRIRAAICLSYAGCAETLFAASPVTAAAQWAVLPPVSLDRGRPRRHRTIALCPSVDVEVPHVPAKLQPRLSGRHNLAPIAVILLYQTTPVGHARHVPCHAMPCHACSAMFAVLGSAGELPSSFRRRRNERTGTPVLLACQWARAERGPGRSVQASQEHRGRAGRTSSVGVRRQPVPRQPDCRFACSVVPLNRAPAFPWIEPVGAEGARRPFRFLLRRPPLTSTQSRVECHCHLHCAT